MADFDTSAEDTFANPEETLLFLDFDDTLFPTTAIFDRWGVPTSEVFAKHPTALPAKLEDELSVWRTAVVEHIATALSLSDGCVIVTNARRPWVEKCIDRFVPELNEFVGTEPGKCKVVYGDEVKLGAKYRRAPIGAALRSAQPSQSERIMHLTKAKRHAMSQEAKQFYSSYRAQTWKNILSFGDMSYEHDAVQEMTFQRKGPSHEVLRTKAVIVRTHESIEHFAQQLQANTRLLPAYVHYNGDLDLDLAEAVEPVAAIATALQVSSSYVVWLLGQRRCKILQALSTTEIR